MYFHNAKKHNPLRSIHFPHANAFTTIYEKHWISLLARLQGWLRFLSAMLEWRSDLSRHGQCAGAHH